MKHYTLQYYLKTEEGDVLAASETGQWQSYTEGDSGVDGFDAALLQLNVGDEREFTIDAEQAFGEYDQSRVMTLAREQFPDSIPVKAQQIVAFTAPTGQEIAGTIIDFNEYFVEVDFNHPMAGKTLLAWVHIKQIEDHS